ncbi:DNA-binding IclR family transcriptional regulator [Sphingobium sp. OAS761]|uniref:IclR family transcriptional regulator n=1 Tax=Sphingobium sp. OAS761 TaxID=2817901 RepID=UPI0020A0CD28|nr:IclR family transcriptional regulator [Sphingobium sp. OAS761]MCP1471279.1 DNA-binding IclR family transcriptional regulator [Sphingobium sp. OAS761]
MARRKTASRERIIAKLPVENNLVKSAGRVLEILEYFDDLQRHSSVMEIADALGFPQSSTSALLRSLVSTGYLNYDARNRTYITSSRVALLGSWVNSPFFAEGAIISMMKELNEQTHDTVVLGMRNGQHIQYIHVIQATSPARLHMTLGTVRPIAASGSGYAVLATLRDAEITRIVMRANAEAEEGTPLLKAREVMDEIAEVRRKGYAFTCDMVTPGGGMIAAPLPKMAGQPQMVLGIGGISEVMRQREEFLASALIKQIEQRFGPQAPYLEAKMEAVTDPLPLAIMRARMQAAL